MVSPDITYDKENEIMCSFMSCYMLAENEFWKGVETVYVQYLRKELGIATMKVVTFDMLCRLLKKDFIKKRKVYYKYYFEHLNEDTFLQQILTRLLKKVLCVRILYRYIQNRR